MSEMITTLSDAELDNVSGGGWSFVTLIGSPVTQVNVGVQGSSQSQGNFGFGNGGFQASGQLIVQHNSVG